MVLAGFILFCASLASSAAMYSDVDSVLELSPTNFKQKVLGNQQLVAVEFYTSWCGHCQTFAPEWMDVAKKLKGLVTIGAIQCDDDKNQALCEKYNIRGYPTIKTFKAKRNDEGVIVKSNRDYIGPRNSKILVEYLLSNMPSNVRSIKGNALKVKSKSSISLEDFLEQDNGTMTKVILFNGMPKSMTLYNVLSLRFGNGQLLMGEVKKREKKVVDAFGVTTFPTLLVLSPGEGDRSAIYSDQFNYKSLYRYLSDVVAADQASKMNATGKILDLPDGDDIELEQKPVARDEL